MRVFVFLVELVVIASLSVWLFFHDGNVVIRWGQDSLDLQIGAAFLGFVALFLVSYSLIGIWRYIVLFPTRMFERAQKMKPAKGIKALTQASIATALDEYDLARTEAQRFERYLGDNPVYQGIIAYNYLKQGKFDEALAACERMKKEDDGTTLAWAIQARVAIAKNQDVIALEYLTKLSKLHGSSPWVVRNLIRYSYRTQQFDRAEAALNRAEKLRLYPGKAIHEANALLQYEKAKAHHVSLEEKESLLERAHRLAPEIPQVSVQYAKVLRMRDKERRARKVLESTWANNPHPMLLEEYLLLESSTEQKDILADVDRLMIFNASDIHSYITMAQFALEHQHWGRARAALHDAQEQHGLNQELCHLYAQLELMEHGNQAAYRTWMEKALTSPVVVPIEFEFEKVLK